MNVDKCPYCYRKSGTWQKDPIKLPKGCPYTWVSNTILTNEPDIEKRINKGIDQICEPEVQEIQDFLKQTEIGNSITPLTEFSPLNTSGKFQITGKHIKEMRDSVEKLLTNFGLTKIDYFNYDEEGNEITQPNGQKLEWTDPITTATDLQKFQVKYIHIEDLRHYIVEEILERWTISPEGILYPDSFNDFTVLGDLGHWYGDGAACPFKEAGTPYFSYTLKPNGDYWDLDSGPLLSYKSQAVLYYEISTKKLKIKLDSGGGVVVSQGIKPPPKGWGAGWDFPYAYWNNHYIFNGFPIPGGYTYGALVEANFRINQNSQVPHYYSTITSNKIFSCQINLGNCIPSQANMRSFGTDVSATEYPYIYISISFVSNQGHLNQYRIEYGMSSPQWGQVFTPGITYYEDTVFDRRLATSFASGPLTADIYQAIINKLDIDRTYILDDKGNKIPPIVHTTGYGISAGIRATSLASEGRDYRAESEPGSASYTPGSLIFFIDDIGIIKKP